MDKTYRKSVTGMAVTLVIAILITNIMTFFQKNIIDAAMRFFDHNSLYRDAFRYSIDFKRMGAGTVIPYYMFFCMFMSLLCFFLTVFVISNKANIGKPKKAIPLFIVYAITPVFGSVYVVLGGDKLLNDPALSGNASLLTLLISMATSPVMMVFFVFFMITVIRFIVKGIKYNRSNAEAKK
ncbi:MAG: hypothetical protein J6W36_05715 [Clostridiales bacterium]|nr:hypothetical protein [Clostridiales bacterium]